MEAIQAARSRGYDSLHSLPVAESSYAFLHDSGMESGYSEIMPEASTKNPHLKSEYNQLKRGFYSVLGADGKVHVFNNAGYVSPAAFEGYEDLPSNQYSLGFDGRRESWGTDYNTNSITESGYMKVTPAWPSEGERMQENHPYAFATDDHHGLGGIDGYANPNGEENGESVYRYDAPMHAPSEADYAHFGPGTDYGAHYDIATTEDQDTQAGIPNWKIGKSLDYPGDGNHYRHYDFGQGNFDVDDA